MPLFNSKDSVDTISTKSASYVEIVHSNGDYLGIQKPIGHADFYVNGGNLHPGCDEYFLKKYLLAHSFEDEVKKGQMFTAIDAVRTAFMKPLIVKMVCSHLVANLMYAESINSKIGFYGKTCKIGIDLNKVDDIKVEQRQCTGDFVRMGGTEQKRMKQGIFYLQTKETPPFALGKGW